MNAFNAEVALRMILEGTSAATGEHFFQSLVYHLAHALGVRYAFLTRCIPGELVTEVQTLAFWQGDCFGQNFTYSIAQTPCQRVLGGHTCYYPTFIQQRFPHDMDLVRLNAESYLGVPIINSIGDVLGHLVIMDDQPQETEPVGLCIMKIFATRAGAELERLTVMERLRYESLHDALTGLPNRACFIGRLRAACQRLKQQPEETFAVLFMDLDRFKVINDSLGHAIGDTLLIEVSQRISACIRSKDIVARLGGDEFAILIETIECQRVVIEVIERIRKALTGTFQLQNHDLKVTTSIGVVFSEPALTSPNVYLRNADLAMYQAKRQRGQCYTVFNQQMHIQALNRLNKEAALRYAIEHNEIQLYYQPIFALSDQRLVGFEALLRWHCRQQQRHILPAEFIPLAEETGLIVPLGWSALRQACSQLKLWCHLGYSDLTMSINMSSAQFEQPNVAAEVIDIINAVGISPSQIRLELTESILVKNPAAIAQAMHKLQACNLQFYLDDFGRGYSSLSSLHELPIDALKIDQKFVSCMTTDPTALAIIKTILVLGKSLGIACVAEGIESVNQLNTLLELGCQLGQGYTFAPAMAPQTATDWLANSKLGVLAPSEMRGD